MQKVSSGTFSQHRCQNKYFDFLTEIQIETGPTHNPPPQPLDELLQLFSSLQLSTYHQDPHQILKI